MGLYSQIVAVQIAVRLKRRSSMPKFVAQRWLAGEGPGTAFWYLLLIAGALWWDPPAFEREIAE
jgi:hypothetical protein